MPFPVVVIILIIFCIAAVITVRTLCFKGSEGSTAAPLSPPEDLAGAQKLAQAVRVKTISTIDYEGTDWDAFKQYHRLMEQLFPFVHERCERIIINGYSLVYRWRAAAPHPDKKPVLITAHMDVVPVEPGTEDSWVHDAFSGAIEDGIVWGRGTLDTKIHMIAALEAAERLIKDGFSPSRDIYLAFGHDEEIDGQEGALKIADYFKRQGLSFDFVLDEGGCVAQNVLEGVRKPIALIGVGEKGFANIKLSVTGTGGHSSMPPEHSALGVVAQAVCRIENHPFKARLIGPIRAFLMNIGPEMSGLNRMILANLWLFKPLFISVFAKTGYGGAMLRTTTAVTMAQASPAPNILPQKASAIANFRILHGETGQDLLAHLQRVLKGLPVSVEPLVLSDPSALSATDCEGYRLIHHLAKSLYPSAVVTPYLVMGGTDARKYEVVSHHIYRFTPYLIDNDEMGKIHGTNENITVENVGRCILFFKTLFERC